MRIQSLLYLSLFFFAAKAVAQSTEAGHADYIRTVNSRAQKIVATLNISDSAKFYRVQNIVAAQYQKLSELHSSRDEAIKKIKATGSANSDTAVKIVQQNAADKTATLHKNYLLQLGKELSEEQITKVKDGMTYNVVNVTYNGYMDMLPNLTAEQKSQIMAWLVEAREYAMDAETSDKKHGWFGKYKGRINNYLSAAGYDLKKETQAWQQRIKERSEKKNISAN